jgi:bifunctional non-homologous end joining protein LigD
VGSQRDTAEATASRKVGRRIIEITHPDRVLFPKDRITKADLVDYYARVAEVMVPHLRDRPLSQHQFPGGIEGGSFWKKQIPDHFPEWIGRVKVDTEKGPQVQILGNDAATLAYLANQNCITPHVWLSRADHLDRPDQITFDLDPPGEDFAPVRDAALALREILDGLGLVPFAKTTGSKGLHVTAPLDRKADFEETRAFAHAVARILAEGDPDRLTMEVRKAKRRGRVFIDIGRNAYGQTAVPPYAVRARDGAPVATPLEWDEVPGLRSARTFTLRNLFRRLSRRSDPWGGMGRRARSLGRAAERLQRL